MLGWLGRLTVVNVGPATGFEIVIGCVRVLVVAAPVAL